MKKALTILGILAGTVVVLVVIAGAVLFWALPSPQSIAQALRSSPKSEETAAAVPETAPAKTEAAAANAAVAAVTPTPVSGVPANTEKQTSHVNVGMETLESYLDERKPLANFCGSLRNAKQMEETGGKFSDRFRDSIGQGEGQDPLIEAMNPILKFNMRQPKIRALLEELKYFDKKADVDSFVGKADFYAKIYGVYTEMTENRAKTEQIMDRTYHLMMMAKVLAQKPELAGDARVTGYCDQIQNALNRDEPVSFEEERKSFQDFLAYSGVDGNSIGYDPKYKTQLKVNLSSTSVTLDGGWIDQVLTENGKVQ